MSLLLSNQPIPWLPFVFPSKPINTAKNVAGHSMFREVLLTDPRSKVRRQTSFFSTASMSPPAVVSCRCKRHFQLGFAGRLKLAIPEPGRSELSHNLPVPTPNLEAQFNSWLHQKGKFITQALRKWRFSKIPASHGVEWEPVELWLLLKKALVKSHRKRGRRPTY